MSIFKSLGSGSKFTPAWDTNTHKSKTLGCLQTLGTEHPELR